MGYLGSKAASGAYQAIIASMPPHDVYIESHLGAGAVMRFKPPAPLSIGLDRNYDVLRSFSCAYSVNLLCADAASTIDSFDYARGGRVLIYSDPPYLHSTRSSSKRYRFEYSESDHIRLLEILKRVPASVILSGYPSRLYDELLSSWRTIEFQVMSRGGPRTEKLWMNFPLCSPHWSTYAGNNFTDRQRIQRKAQRWAANFRHLPAGEKTAILSALLDTLNFA